jgi:hypothetical protein
LRWKSGDLLNNTHKKYVISREILLSIPANRSPFHCNQ